MSKRLFIWIGLIILIGVISAAGWSVYVTVNRPEAESPPPPVRGKIPQMPQTTSGDAIHRANVPPAPVPEQEQTTLPVPEEKTPAADTEVTPAPQSQNTAPAPTDQSAEQAPMTPQEQPTPEPVEQAAVETPAGQDGAQDSEAESTPESPAVPADTPAQDETPASPAAEPEPENQAAQPTTPEPVSPEQPAPAEQAVATTTTEPEPEAKQAPKPKVPLDSLFTIQVAAYRNKTYAENMLAALSSKGYEAYIFEDTDAKARAWYAVRIGHFPTRQAAQWALNDYQEKEQKKGIIARSGVR